MPPGELVSNVGAGVPRLPFRFSSVLRWSKKRR
jgi:hypothetical protein